MTGIMICLAIITLVNAIVVTVVQWRAYGLDQQRFKFSAYDKRYQILEGIRSMLGLIMGKGQADFSDVIPLIPLQQQAFFLMGPKMEKYIGQIYKKGLELAKLTHLLEGEPRGDKRSDLVERQGEAFLSLTKELENLQENFKEYLQLES